MSGKSKEDTAGKVTATPDGFVANEWLEARLRLVDRYAELKREAAEQSPGSETVAGGDG
jgi:hypothetical protein